MCQLHLNKAVSLKKHICSLWGFQSSWALSQLSQQTEHPCGPSHPLSAHIIFPSPNPEELDMLSGLVFLLFCSFYYSFLEKRQWNLELDNLDSNQLYPVTCLVGSQAPHLWNGDGLWPPTHQIQMGTGMVAGVPDKWGRSLRVLCKLK